MNKLSYNLADVVAIWQLKNGKMKFSFKEKEGNVFKTLHLLGFCRCKVGNKFLYYRRRNKDISITSFREMKLVLIDYLKKCDLTTLPFKVNIDDILNAFLGQKPIGDKELCKYYLCDFLNPVEEMQLRKGLKYFPITWKVVEGGYHQPHILELIQKEIERNL